MPPRPGTKQRRLRPPPAGRVHRLRLRRTRTPLKDLGYLAWSWCISSRPDRGPVTEQARQVRLLTEAYGLGTTDRSRLLAAVETRLDHNLAFWHRLLDRPWSGTGAAPQEVVTWTRDQRAFLGRHRHTFARHLAT